MRFRINRDDAPAGGGGSVKVDNTNPPPVYTPPEINMAEALPPEFRDKPFFKDKTFVDVIKDHANLQTLLGQRPAGIPKEDAPQEEWDKFLGAIKPKSVDEYGFPETEFSKAGKRNPGYEKAVRDIAAKVGVPKRQFGAFVSEIEQHLFNADKAGQGQSAEELKKREDEFEALLDKTYSKDKQTVIDRTKKLMTEMIDPAMKDQVSKALSNLSNEALFALTAVLNNVHKKYIAEDGVPDGTNTGADTAAMQQEAEKIMMSKAYNDFREPGHDEAKQKVRELFQQIANAKKS